MNSAGRRAQILTGAPNWCSPYSTDQVEVIAAKLGVGLVSRHISDVIKAARCFQGHVEADIDAQAHPRKDAADQLDALARGARLMLKGFPMNMMARTALARQAIDPEGFENDLRTVVALAATHHAEASTAQRRRGAPVKLSRVTLFRTLAEIYERATGGRATVEVDRNDGEPTGRFFFFIEEATRSLPGMQDLKDTGLADAILRATGKRG